MTPTMLCWSLILLASQNAVDGAEKVRYLRPAGKLFATECTFTLKKTKAGSSIESVTERGKTTMTVSASHDADHRLTRASASLRVGDDAKTASVSVAGAKAKVERDGLPVQEFEAPAGVIVTSAPDWTDTFLLCRRYDRKKGGKQSFAGLWIHPTQPSQRLTFTIERHDPVTIVHAGKKLMLERYTIRLRGNSAYAAWADANGKMIKLVPLPYREGAANWLVLDGFEKSTLSVQP